MGNDTIKVIRSRFSELQKILKIAQKALKGAPPGNLRVSKVRDKAYFYKRNDPACGKDVYIPKKNEELILTYETAETTFDSLDAKRQIRHYLQ